ncbi:uncharacterized protein LOC144709069 [Wolffia australiana]
MATKTQAASVFLLLNMVFFTFTNGQLLSPVVGCLTQTLQLVTYGTALSLVKITGVTDTLTTACCGLFVGLTPDQSAKCLCIFLQTNLLGINLNVSIPGDINKVVNACGKQVSLFRCLEHLAHAYPTHLDFIFRLDVALSGCCASSILLDPTIYGLRKPVLW